MMTYGSIGRFINDVLTCVDCFVICRLVTSRTSINQLLILRLIVHPTIWTLLIAVFSNTVRHIGTVLQKSTK